MTVSHHIKISEDASDKFLVKVAELFGSMREVKGTVDSFRCEMKGDVKNEESARMIAQVEMAVINEVRMGSSCIVSGAASTGVGSGSGTHDKVERPLVTKEARVQRMEPRFSLKNIQGIPDDQERYCWRTSNE